jgi:hypothetical protein
MRGWYSGAMGGGGTKGELPPAPPMLLLTERSSPPAPRSPDMALRSGKVDASPAPPSRPRCQCGLDSLACAQPRAQALLHRRHPNSSVCSPCRCPTAPINGCASGFRRIGGSTLNLKINVTVDGRTTEWRHVEEPEARQRTRGGTDKRCGSG